MANTGYDPANPHVGFDDLVMRVSKPQSVTGLAISDLLAPSAWVCPVCGGGVAPTVSRCPCKPCSPPVLGRPSSFDIERMLRDQARPKDPLDPRTLPH